MQIYVPLSKSRVKNEPIPSQKRANSERLHYNQKNQVYFTKEIFRLDIFYNCDISSIFVDFSLNFRHFKAQFARKF